MIQVVSSYLTDRWPSVLGTLNFITLEQALCEWGHWHELRLDCNKKRKLYRFNPEIQLMPKPAVELGELSGLDAKR